MFPQERKGKNLPAFHNDIDPRCHGDELHRGGQARTSAVPPLLQDVADEDSERECSDTLVCSVLFWARVERTEQNLTIASGARPCVRVWGWLGCSDGKVFWFLCSGSAMKTPLV